MSVTGSTSVTRLLEQGVTPPNWLGVKTTRKLLFKIWSGYIITELWASPPVQLSFVTTSLHINTVRQTSLGWFFLIKCVIRDNDW